MAETIIFWFRWGWTATRSMPEFVGNNRTGVVFACVFVFFYECKNFYSSPAFGGASTLGDKLRLLGPFLKNHWEGTLRLWLCVILAFLVGHTLDLVRHSNGLLMESNQALSANATGEGARQELVTGAIRQNLDQTISDLKQSCAELRGANQELSKRSGDQQTTINNCQTQAISLLAPKELRLTIWPLGDGDSSQPTARAKKATFIVITNKSIAPVEIVVSCDQPITTGFMPVRLLGIGAFSAGANRISATSVRMVLTSPELTPIFPEVLEVLHDGKLGLQCTFQRTI